MPERRDERRDAQPRDQPAVDRTERHASRERDHHDEPGVRSRSSTPSDWSVRPRLSR